MAARLCIEPILLTRGRSHDISCPCKSDLIALDDSSANIVPRRECLSSAAHSHIIFSYFRSVRAATNRSNLNRDSKYWNFAISEQSKHGEFSNQMVKFEARDFQIAREISLGCSSTWEISLEDMKISNIGNFKNIVTSKIRVIRSFPRFGNFLTPKFKTEIELWKIKCPDVKIKNSETECLE